MFLIASLILLAINFIVAGEMSKIAREKGFSGSRYFHYSFWLGPAGWFIVIALPDLKARPHISQFSSQDSFKGTISNSLLQDIETNLPNL